MTEIEMKLESTSNNLSGASPYSNSLILVQSTSDLTSNDIIMNSTPSHLTEHFNDSLPTQNLTLSTSTSTIISDVLTSSTSSGNSNLSSSIETKPFEMNSNNVEEDVDELDSMTLMGLSTTLWESENTIAFSVAINGHTVAKRADNGYINCTKLLNLANTTRGVRDGILKSEVGRIVMIRGARHLRGIWVNSIRSRELAERYSITHLLYPLFEPIETIISQIVSQPNLQVETRNLILVSQAFINRRMSSFSGTEPSNITALKGVLNLIKDTLPEENERSQLSTQLSQAQAGPSTTRPSTPPRRVLRTSPVKKSKSVPVSSSSNLPSSDFTFGTLNLTPSTSRTSPTSHSKSLSTHSLESMNFDSISRRNTCPHIDYTPTVTPGLSPTISPTINSTPSTLAELPFVSTMEILSNLPRRGSLDSNFTATKTSDALVDGIESGSEGRAGKRRFSDVSAAVTLTRLAHAELPLPVTPVNVDTEVELVGKKLSTVNEKTKEELTRKLKKVKTVKEENFRNSKSNASKKLRVEDSKMDFEPLLQNSVLVFHSHPETNYTARTSKVTHLSQPIPFAPLKSSTSSTSLPNRYQSPPIQSETYLPPLPSVISSIMSSNLPATSPYYDLNPVQPQPQSQIQPVYRSSGSTLGFAPSHRDPIHSTYLNYPLPTSNGLQYQNYQHPALSPNPSPHSSSWNYQASYTSSQTSYSALNSKSPQLNPLVTPPTQSQSHQVQNQSQSQHLAPIIQNYSTPIGLYQDQFAPQNSNPPLSQISQYNYQPQSQYNNYNSNNNDTFCRNGNGCSSQPFPTSSTTLPSISIPSSHNSNSTSKRNFEPPLPQPLRARSSLQSFQSLPFPRPSLPPSSLINPSSYSTQSQSQSQSQSQTRSQSYPQPRTQNSLNLIQSQTPSHLINPTRNEFNYQYIAPSLPPHQRDLNRNRIGKRNIVDQFQTLPQVEFEFEVEVEGRRKRRGKEEGEGEKEVRFIGIGEGEGEGDGVGDGLGNLEID